MAWTEHDDQTLTDLAAQGLSVRAIGERMGRSKTTVARRLQWLGVTLDRSQVTAAAEAAREHNKARRALLSARLLDEAEYALDLIHEPHVHVLKDGSLVHLDRPDAASHRNYATVAGIAVDKHLAIERVDTDGGQRDAVSVLEKMVGAWGIPRTADDAPDVDETGVGDLPDAEDDEP